MQRKSDDIKLHDSNPMAWNHIIWHEKSWMNQWMKQDFMAWNLTKWSEVIWVVEARWKELKSNLRELK